MVSEIDKAGVYLDFDGLNSLRDVAKTDQKEAMTQVAKQFEAIFLQMALKSMREANSAFSSDLFGSQYMDMYQDMFDQQMSLTLSEKGLGVAKFLQDKLDTMVPDKTAVSVDYSSRLKEYVEEK